MLDSSCRSKEPKRACCFNKNQLNQEGEVVFSKIINDKMLGNNTFFRAASESAMRAVNHPECKKLKVPKKKYDTWNEIILDFDPSQSLN